MYTRTDYPDALKNLDKVVRDKAIDIINAMLAEGYDEGDAIPIAIDQAKEWEEDAQASEKRTIRKQSLTDHEEDEGPSSARLQDADVVISYNRDEEAWQVKSQGAKQVEGYYETKKEARDRGQEIAENKDSQLIVKNKDDEA